MLQGVPSSVPFRQLHLDAFAGLQVFRSEEGSGLLPWHGPRNLQEVAGLPDVRIVQWCPSAPLGLLHLSSRPAPGRVPLQLRTRAASDQSRRGCGQPCLPDQHGSAQL
ncbi:unnamed protein product [Symbiodinium sp. CCMP2456]|nr:unnamed protein product [Symbiodinium sp. CCMP2456]